MMPLDAIAGPVSPVFWVAIVVAIVVLVAAVVGLVAALRTPRRK